MQNFLLLEKLETNGFPFYAVLKSLHHILHHLVVGITLLAVILILEFLVKLKPS
jgi:hypothetical protein